MKNTMNKLKLALTIFMMIIAVSNIRAEEIISTRVIGKGQPMILIHGMSCSADVWTEVADRYKSQYQVHLVTLKGFGNKETAEKEHFLQAVRDELIVYVKKNKLKNTVLMGHSMGGFLSLWAAAEAPGLFAKIISVDGIPYFPILQMPGITPESAGAMVKQIQSGMLNTDDDTYRQQQNMIINTMVATENKKGPVVEMGMSSNRKVIGQAYGEMFTTDIRPEMEKVKAPVLILGAWAAYEMYGSTKSSVESAYKAQCKGMDNVKVAVADKAYHFIFYDEPEWFYSQVDAFLKSN